MLRRKFALRMPLLAQGFDAAYGHEPPLVYALSLFVAFEITGGDVVAYLLGYHVQGAGGLAGSNLPSSPGTVASVLLHKRPTG